MFLTVKLAKNYILGTFCLIGKNKPNFKGFFHAKSKVGLSLVTAKGDQQKNAYKNIAFQGLPFCGHDDSNENFIQLMLLRGVGCPMIEAWMK